MSKALKVYLVAAVALAVVAVVSFKRADAPADSTAGEPPSIETRLDRDLPRLMDFGKGKCAACKAMKPVLAALRSHYPDTLLVQYVDLEADPDAAEMFEITIIPTQIFFDDAGMELWRHEGFLSEDTVVAKFRELGVALGPPVGNGGTGGPSGLMGRASAAIEGTAALALGGAFVWGVLSVLLSPCHLASIPLIVAFIGGQGTKTSRRAFAIASLFSAGILVTIGVIGAATAAAGRLVGDVGPGVNYAMAALFCIVGLHLLGVFPMPWSGPGQVGMKRRGLLAAFILGLVFGVAIGPCTFAYMAPVLGLVFRVGAGQWVYGTSLLLAYGVGHSAVIVVAGTSVDRVQRYLKWGERSRGPAIVKAVCGVLVCLGGLYLIHVA